MCLNLFRPQSECAAAEIERGRGDKETRGEPRMECPGKVKKGGGKVGGNPEVELFEYFFTSRSRP